MRAGTTVPARSLRGAFTVSVRSGSRRLRREPKGLEHAFGRLERGAKPPALEGRESSAERLRALGDEYRQASLRLDDVAASEAEIRLPFVQILLGVVANDNVVLETQLLHVSR